jgi:hypothetical protein
MSEEEIPPEETPVEEKPKKPDCYVVPEHIKPLLDCCQDFDEGKIDASEFFARTLVKTGEFMQAVKKRQEATSIE